MFLTTMNTEMYNSAIASTMINLTVQETSRDKAMIHDFTSQKT